MEAAGEQGFLFITDLAEKAHGAELVVLMVLFIGSQIASTMVMSVTADKTQQRIMLLLPLFFAALIPNFPAGLILYWITTNFWTLGQQLVVRSACRRRPQLAKPAQGGRGERPRRRRRRRGSRGGGGRRDGTKAPPPPPRKKKRRRR